MPMANWHCIPNQKSLKWKFNNVEKKLFRNIIMGDTGPREQFKQKFQEAEYLFVHFYLKYSTMPRNGEFWSSLF